MLKIFALAAAKAGLAFALSGFFIIALAGPSDTVWTSLFNGKDLKDWEVKVQGYAYNEDPRNTFRVTADSAVEVNYSNYTNWTGEPWSHLAYKVRPFSHYVVRLEYQFYGKQVTGGPDYANQNSGIMLHSQSLSTMPKNQNWPISLEFQFLGPATKLSPGSGNLCTPGTAVEFPKGTFNDNHCINVTVNTFAGSPDWVRARAEVFGDSLIRHFIQEKAVLTYYKPMTQQGAVGGNTVPIVDRKPLGSGYVLLQSESSPIRFRRIELANLQGCMDPASPAYKSYYVKNDPAACAPLAAKPGERLAGSITLGAGARLRVDLEGSYALKLAEPDGRLLWTARGAGSKSFGLPRSGMRGIRLLSVERAGETLVRKILFEP